jgi:hypothetical protein
VCWHRSDTYNLEENVACRESLTLTLLPVRNATLSHSRAHSRHGKLGEGLAARGGVKSYKHIILIQQ